MNQNKKTRHRNLSNDVNWENQDYRKYNQSTFTYRFTDFIEQAIQKIKEFDLDLNLVVPLKLIIFSTTAKAVL
ncbi:hypothetical protein KHA80_13500 [Anaerobacillus sp. HL2]|nr:hypothetical protein KHA80_13500 [Anaerobacillus sp. HL2]